MTFFKEWVGKELDGYNDDDTFPEYRVLTVHAKGYFRGPMGASPIISHCQPVYWRKKYRNWATTIIRVNLSPHLIT